LKLSQCTEGQVVRNANNGNHYRYERPERSRIRIRPLELFPNGILIPKPTDTHVDPDIEVQLLGDWCHGMAVEGKPTHCRATYERELAKCLLDLDTLRIAYDLLPPAGKGKESRGSWANKIKNCDGRIAVLRAGLEERLDLAPKLSIKVERRTHFRHRDIVQLPSGLPAKILQIRGTNVTVLTRSLGETYVGTVPVEILRPWAQARLATA
jgi:hypothetical protein